MEKINFEIQFSDCVNFIYREFISPESASVTIRTIQAMMKMKTSEKVGVPFKVVFIDWKVNDRIAHMRTLFQFEEDEEFK